MALPATGVRDLRVVEIDAHHSELSWRGSHQLISSTDIPEMSLALTRTDWWQRRADGQ